MWMRPQRRTPAANASVSFSHVRKQTQPCVAADANNWTLMRPSKVAFHCSHNVHYVFAEIELPWKTFFMGTPCEIIHGISTENFFHGNSANCAWA